MNKSVYVFRCKNFKRESLKEGRELAHKPPMTPSPPKHQKTKASK